MENCPKKFEASKIDIVKRIDLVTSRNVVDRNMVLNFPKKERASNSTSSEMSIIKDKKREL